LDSKRALKADHTSADSQTSVDADQTSVGADQTSVDADQTSVDEEGIAGAQGGDAGDLTRELAQPHLSLMEQLEQLGAEAAADRAGAAEDRAQAASDRIAAAREHSRLEAELHSAHLDQLTGAYRREMGELALSNEIERARRSDGRFVLAFVDVDGLKVVNDRDGHAAGDRVLQTVVRAIRAKLRSFDPVIRYGGDEFVCGLATDFLEAKRRFDLIRIAIEADTHVSISVGLAVLVAGDTVDALTERADAAMLEVKAEHHSRE
jgi:diguanylate cyclase (GGDEF)-like protein